MGAQCSRRSEIKEDSLLSPEEDCADASHTPTGAASSRSLGDEARGKRRARRKQKSELEGEEAREERRGTTLEAEAVEASGWKTVMKDRRDKGGRDALQEQSPEELRVSKLRVAVDPAQATAENHDASVPAASSKSDYGNNLKGRDRVVAYLESIIEKLDSKSGPPSPSELETKVMPAVVDSIRSLLANAPSGTRESIRSVLQECQVVPDFKADCAMFREALQRCLDLARRTGSKDRKKEPNARPVSFTVKNTFIDLPAGNGDGDGGDDDDDDSGQKYFRATSDPTGGVRQRTPDTTPSAQLRAESLECIVDGDERLQELETNGTIDVETTGAIEHESVTRVAAPEPLEKVAEVSEPAVVPLPDELAEQADESRPVFEQPLDAPKFVIRNTFVTKVGDEDEDDEEEGDALADYRSCSDPTTGGLREWHERLKLGLGGFARDKSSTDAEHALDTVLDASSNLSDAALDEDGQAVDDESGIAPDFIRQISFKDQEGDVTTLKAAGSASGILSLEINGERLEDIASLELEFVGDGQYCVYMQGMGAVVVDPPPGPKQHQLCQQLLELAGICGVPVRSRSTGSAIDGLDLSSLQNDASQALAAEGAENYQAGGYMLDGGFNYLGTMQWDFNYPWYDGLKSMGDQTALMGGNGTPGPVLGYLHSFHSEVCTMGQVKENFRQFTKVGFEGRLSVISESQVHVGGTHRFLVQFTSGNLSKADGVGFIFSPRLPCKKNIQRIVSIFVNQRGTICMRVLQDVIRAPAHVKSLKCGDWVEMIMDLDNSVAYFTVWPKAADAEGRTRPTSHAEFAFANRMISFYKESGSEERPDLDLSTGHLACVVKNVDVTVTLGS